MRKAEREIKGRAEQEDILRRAEVLRLAMCRDGQPYVVPMNFAYEDGHIWLHCARQGMKIDFLRANPRVCFEASVDVELAPGGLPCDWSARFRSVIGFGRAVEVADEAERRRGLTALGRRYAGEPMGELNEQAAAAACVLRIDIESMSGKKNRV